MRSGKVKDDKRPVQTGGKPKDDAANGGNVGDALRAVYQDAIAESVPDEMLDLLKKLG